MSFFPSSTLCKVKVCHQIMMPVVFEESRTELFLYQKSCLPRMMELCRKPVQLWNVLQMLYYHKFFHCICIVTEEVGWWSIEAPVKKSHHWRKRIWTSSFVKTGWKSDKKTVCCFHFCSDYLAILPALSSVRQDNVLSQPSLMRLDAVDRSLIQRSSITYSRRQRVMPKVDEESRRISRGTSSVSWVWHGTLWKVIGTIYAEICCSLIVYIRIVWQKTDQRYFICFAFIHT